MINRRKFIQKAALAAGASITAPYILPSGRLFAQTGLAMADHVVFVLFAGGVRQQEAIYQRYLADSQGVDIEGNVLYNMLPGEGPDIKIVYGVDTADGQPGGQPIDRILSTPLSEQGTLFPELRYSGGGTGHYGGLSTGVSGYYGTTQGLQQRPLHPTIFEYLRRHRGSKATDIWFIGNGIGGSTPLLNHSEYAGYGSRYGANFFAPTVTFGYEGERHLKGFKCYHPEEELDPVRQMRAFLNQNFLRQGQAIPNLNNTEEEKEDIKAFIKSTFERLENNEIAFPPVTDNGDLATVGFTTEVLRWFKPQLTVVNMNSVDTCHSSFTGYLKALHRGDHAIGHLWNFIQTQVPEMAGNTALIVMPEHGRNLQHNSIMDENDWFSFDHDSDENSRRIFAMMAGPGIDANLRVGSEANPIGDAADIVPTIAQILGIKSDVINAGLLNGNARSLFDRI
ncbi:MAG: alkaline phosphatase family protein [Bacteroidota bacterium]